MKYDLLLQEKLNNKIVQRYHLFGDEKPITHLPNIKNINIFVGANNSGKSWMMRHLMQIENYNKVDYEDLIIWINDFNLNSYANLSTGQKPGTWHSDGNAPNININKFTDLTLEEVEKRNQDNIVNINNLLRYSHWERFDTRIEKTEIDSLKEAAENIKKILSNLVESKSPNKIYIPTLRTAHSLYDDSHNKIENDIFQFTLSYNYKESIQNIPELEIFTGLTLYQEILKARNSEKTIRDLFESFERFLSESFYEGKNVDIVAKFEKGTSNQEENIIIHIEGENETRKLYDLGDGIQAIIILMYKIFMAEDKTVIFIDEPELNLHPGMQRLFFEQITYNPDITKKNLTFYITTHSNHLLDLTLESNDVSIYSFSPLLDKDRNKKFIINNVNAGNNDLLRELGVNNSSVFLANCSIWVEGISDRNYIKAFLWAYCKANDHNYPKEDIDFAFFEYAGGNIIHYLFDEKFNNEEETRFLDEINTLALNNRIFLFADSDMSDQNQDSEKYNRLKNLESKFGSANLKGRIIWGFRESENLLSKDIWKKILLEFCNKKLIKNKEKEILDAIESEIDNLTLDKTEYIGILLKTKIPELNIIWKEDSASNPQTFRDKAELSRIILQKTMEEKITWDDFKQIQEVELLTEQIFTFIKEKGKNQNIHNEV
ncbi:ATP-binding protein [Chryseobacterium wangxinyae]|uniref:ATP-dependent nuclease n=1 Tax=Chryseobacterium sp. CY350 TaxID=2997336 RepID=UPI00226D7DDB|nr:ATP-binding protein [Chryseobacterium sp. CY350]MCY0977611.1 ATP-binding protein [Chryseobacterium sp. CY350]WBZ95380.1 ATP-binding protein [Chryseobacterium sp. CY350]